MSARSRIRYGLGALVVMVVVGTRDQVERAAEMTKGSQARGMFSTGKH